MLFLFFLKLGEPALEVCVEFLRPLVRRDLRQHLTQRTDLLFVRLRGTEARLGGLVLGGEVGGDGESPVSSPGCSTALIRPHGRGGTDPRLTEDTNPTNLVPILSDRVRD